MSPLQSDKANLFRLGDLVQFLQAALVLVHELQKERGLSGGYLASEGRRFTKDLDRQTQEAERAFQTTLDIWMVLEPSRFSPGLRDALDQFLAGKTDLETHRFRVRNQEVGPQESVLFFSRKIQELHGLLGVLLEDSPDPAITLGLSAVRHFAAAKEFLGRERAWGFQICTSGKMEPGQKNQGLQFIDQRKESLAIFLRHIGAPLANYWKELEQSLEFQELDRLRSTFQSSSREPENQFPSPDLWFSQCTQVMECHREFELLLLEELEQTALKIMRTSRPPSAGALSSEAQRLFLRFRKERLQDVLLDDFRKNQVPVVGRKGSRDLDSSILLRNGFRRWVSEWNGGQPLEAMIPELEKKARLLYLDASIDAVGKDELARESQELLAGLEDFFRGWEDWKCRVDRQGLKVSRAHEKFVLSALGRLHAKGEEK